MDGELYPTIQDTPQITHNVFVDSSQNVSNLPAIKDVAVIKGHQVDSGFYVDENGTRHYIIDAKDVPILKTTP